MKYSKEEIKQKAIKFKEYVDASDPRVSLMLMMLSLATGVSSDECIRRIELLAQD